MGLLRPRRSLREQHRSEKFYFLRNGSLADATSPVSRVFCFFEWVAGLRGCGLTETVAVLAPMLRSS